MAATAFATARVSYTPAQTSGRNGSIDYLRFVGSIGIIWFHLHLPGAEIGLAALPMFVALFVCFGVGKDVASLNRRLLYPWLLWSAIFGLAKVAQAMVTGAPIGSEFEWWMLLAGPAIHLWFLPFSYLFVLLANQMHRQTWGAVNVILVPCSIWLTETGLPHPFAQWVTVIPAACMGLALNHFGPLSRQAHVLGWGSVAIAVLMMIAGRETVALQYALGISAVLLAFTVQMRATRVSRLLSEISFGVYLLHPLIFALVLLLPLGGIEMQAGVVILGSVVGTSILRRVTPALV